jgi:parA
MLNLLDEASIMNPNLKALIVNNKASTNPMLKGKNDKYIDFLKEIDLSGNIKLADTILYEREIYKNVVFDGKSVIEIESDNRAKNEISSLYHELLEFAKNTKEIE